jgi:Tfp pilus assembly protein FimT
MPGLISWWRRRRARNRAQDIRDRLAGVREREAETRRLLEEHRPGQRGTSNGVTP